MVERDLPNGVGITAVSMAAERRAESARPDHLFSDPVASLFVDMAQTEAEIPGLADDVTLSDMLPVYAGYAALRTRYFDDLLLDACRSGCRQVVVPAAGLDGRGFRLPWPEGTRLYELDIPEVLAFKRRALTGADVKPTCPRVEIPVDLRSDWPRPLRAAGFDPSQPTAWVVEGLMVYMDDPDNDRLLERIARLSAPGSHMFSDHMQVDLARIPESGEIIDALAGIDDIWRSSVEDPAGWLAGYGWTVEVADPVKVAAQYDRPVPPVLDQTDPDAANAWLITAWR
jgi:methyltransferase (TIGR00027 family)